MSTKRSITIASILLLIILIIIGIGIGIGIASTNKLRVADLHHNAELGLEPAFELQRLAVRRDALSLGNDLNGLVAAEHQVLSLDVL